jgi:REP element-mobilizing transposase RayT
MARPLRLEYAGAVWHVTSRGNAKEKVFEDDEDREAFLEVLSRVVTMFRWKLHAYVLMGNHYHLLVETPEPNLSRGMRQLNGIYTQRFNRRHERVGHLFQGRFKGILVEKDRHLLELARYVVLNPVRAGIARAPRDWPWSSYRVTAGLAEVPDWLETAATLDCFGRSKSVAQAAYREFVKEGPASGYEPWKAVREQLVLGSEAFALELGRRGRSPNTAAEIPKPQRLLGRPTIETIVTAVKEIFGAGEGSIPENQRGAAREAVAYLARTEGAWPIAEIGSRLGVKAWSASHLASAGARRVAEDRGFRKQVETVTGILRDGITRKQT